MQNVVSAMVRVMMVTSARRCLFVRMVIKPIGSANNFGTAPPRSVSGAVQSRNNSTKTHIMKHQNQNVARWLRNPDFEAFQRQMSVDLLCGRSRGVKRSELRDAFNAFVKAFRENNKAIWGK